MIQLTLIVGAIGCFLLGVLVVLHNARKLVNLLSAGINFCLATWLLSILFFMEASTIESAFVSAKIYYIVAAIFVALLTLFAYIFPKGEQPPKFISIITILSCTVVVSLLLILPGFITAKVVIDTGGNYIDVDKLSYIAYSLYFIFFFLFGIIVILRKYMISNKKIKAQLGIYLFGILCMAIPGLVTDLLLPYFQNYQLIWVGPAMASVFLILVSYGIARHGLFDIRLAAVRTLAYILSLATMAVAYYYIAYIISLVFFQGNTSSSVSFSPINITLALLLAFIFQPVKRFFDKVTNRVFYKDNYNTDDFFARLNRSLTLTTDLRGLLERAAYEIGRTLKSEQAFFFINTDDGHYVSAGTAGHKQLPKSDVMQMGEYYRESQGVIIASMLDASSPIRRLMLSHRIELILPLVQDEKIVGYLCLGDHLTSGYTSRDIKALNTISNELVIAIQNALSVQEVRELNATLQQRVDNATKELRASNAMLRKLDKVKDEFVSIASHQLRTPLTSVKGYISMVLDGDAGEISNSQRHLLDEAFISSERMVHLINDFLNVSRLQTGKFIIDRHPIDLSKIVGQEIDSLQPSAIARNLKYIYHPPKNFPILDIDEGKIRQVVMNFADNSLYYSHENTKINVNLSVEGNEVLFTVKDTGIGVPLSEQAQLFGKFYRASNAKKQRPDGTGVGLFLAKKVIDAHGGQVVFESVEGEGSTFGFRLPLPRQPL
jgi:signal transduction histidine kinase